MRYNPVYIAVDFENGWLVTKFSHVFVSYLLHTAYIDDEKAELYRIIGNISRVSHWRNSSDYVMI